MERDLAESPLAEGPLVVEAEARVKPVYPVVFESSAAPAQFGSGMAAESQHLDASGRKKYDQGSPEEGKGESDAHVSEGGMCGVAEVGSAVERGKTGI